MAVGDFFFVPDKTRNTLTPYCWTVGKKLNRKFHTQLIYAHETLDGWEPCAQNHPGAVLGIGVWRTA